MSNDTQALPQFSVYPPGNEQGRRDVAVGTITIFTITGMVCVCLRIYTRACIVRNMGSEDWVIVVAAALTLVFAIQLLISAKEYNMGFSGSSLTMSQLVESSKMGLAVIAVYKSTVTLIKVSILMIYLRLSVTNTFKWLCKGSISLLLTYQAIVIVIIPLECVPLRKMWDFTGTVPGRCIDTAAFYYITSAFHIVVDIWILLLPYKLIFSIPRPLRERLAVYAVFGLGAFSTLCAIIRFRFLVVVLHSMDPYYDSLGVNVWSIIEVNVGIVCASMPTLRPLISRAQSSRTRCVPKVAEEIEKPTTSPRRNKRGGLLQAREMFITLGTFTAMTLKSSKDAVYDEEDWGNEKPPPVPPKDVKVTPNVTYPDMAYQKL